jgi:hypothetical protein
MNNKKYNIYDVLIGLFNNFPVNKTRYSYNEEEFNRFFYNNREYYEILDTLAFDSDGVFPASKELTQAHDNLIVFKFLDIYSTKNMEHLNKFLFNTSFNKFNKNRFKESELIELMDLSEEFQKQFCTKTD